VTVLRQFLYLDPELVEQFLAQMEGGTFSEESQRLRETRGRERGADAGASALGAHAGIRAGKTSGQEEELERIIKRTAESAFSRLYELLQEQNAVQWLEAFDDEIWNGLRRGEILEVEASISVSSLAKYMNLVQQAGPLMGLMEAIGEEVDDETKSAMSMIGMFGQMLGNAVPIVARAVGAPEFKFVATLNPAHVRPDVDQLEGEATLLAKIQRKLDASERYTVLNLIPGIRALPSSERREMEADLSNSPEFPDMVIDGPLAVTTAIAVYR
jgi:hypothetical protein